MARNYSNYTYETFSQAQTAANLRNSKEGPDQALLDEGFAEIDATRYIVHAHFDQKTKVRTWRIASRSAFLARWEKNQCGKVKNRIKIRRRVAHGVAVISAKLW